jgi:hypothetical protein
VAALALLALARGAEAGPWALGPGRLYAKLGYQSLDSTTYSYPDGFQTTIPTFKRDDADLYVAYGINDTLTLVTSVPYRSSDLEDDPDELGRVGGIGDVRAELQVQLGRRGPWVFATRGVVQFPTGDETKSGGLQATGSGVWEAEAWLGAGSSLWQGRGYGYAGLGYQYRGGGLRDGFVYALQLGWNTTTRLVLAANLRGVEPYSTTPGDRTPGSPVGVGDRVAYAAYGPTLIFKVTEQLGVQFDVDGAFHTRNIATGTMFRIALFVHR